MDSARQTWTHVVGSVQRSPILKKLLIREPTSKSCWLRHPATGWPIEIKVVAGSAAGRTLVSRYCMTCIFDEAPRMHSAADAVVNLDEMRAAVALRIALIPGAQMLLVGSPWAPFGPVYELVEEFHGSPSKKLVVCRAPAYRMNPRDYTPEVCEREQKLNPDKYEVDVEANFMDPEQGMFTLAAITAVTRKEGPEILPFDSRYHYRAAMDPGFRGNAWALVIVTNGGVNENGRSCLQVVLTHQWIGTASAPKNSREVFKEIAALVKPYGIRSIHSDSHYIDVLRNDASDVGLGIVEQVLTQQVNVEMYTKLKQMVTDRTIELPPNLTMQRDLVSVKKVTTQSSVRIEIPVGRDGRHGDYASALALAVYRSIWAPEPLPPTAEEQARLDARRTFETLRRKQKQRLAERFRAYR